MPEQGKLIKINQTCVSNGSFKTNSTQAEGNVQQKSWD